jgi:hypothetical protein
MDRFSPNQRLDQLQVDHEREVVKSFITSYNTKHRTAFAFVGHGDDARLLLFRERERVMRAQLSTAYYDMLAQRLLWMPVPPRPVGPKIQTGFDFEEALVQCINQELADRCTERVNDCCVLLVSVHPITTTTTMLTEAVNRVVPPERHSFEGVYLLGHLAVSKRFGQAEIGVRQLA